MLKHQIHLSIVEEPPPEIPEDIRRMGMEALQALWHTSQRLAQGEIETAKKRYQQYETEVLQQRQEALDKIKQVSREIEVSKIRIETLTRENKSLQVDLNRQTGELKSAEDQIQHLQEKLTQQEYEIKRLTEDLGRSRENSDVLQKRLHEAVRQAEQDRAALKDITEESAVNLRMRERLDQDLKSARLESEQMWKQLKQEQTRAVVSEALVQEMKETIKKLENEIKLLKQEKREIRENMEGEIKVRLEMEKNVAASTARAESQEWGYKEMIHRLEKELEVAKSESSTLRNRLIKAEGALEREKKAIERLETKLVAATGSKIS